ncbi:MAG: GNAT family N-acetyltransferase [Planctomycetaceae bacterium]
MIFPFTGFSGPFQVLPLDMDRDYEDIDRLFESEEWPFIRADLEVSHAQPRSTAFVARSEEQLLGFFATHHFGDIGYLDMMIVNPLARVSHVALKLYTAATRQMKQKGMKSWVAHSTNDSYRMFKLMRFQQGQSFTLLAKDPLSADSDSAGLDTIRLGRADQDLLVDLDRDVFGLLRVDWINALLQQSAARFYGRKEGDRLVASACVRSRRGNAVCLDAVNGRSVEDVVPLLEPILQGLACHRIECFARTDSALHHYLLEQQFAVPDFFESIGPLVEWRKGPTGDAGLSDRILSLSWF